MKSKKNFNFIKSKEGVKGIKSIKSKLMIALFIGCTLLLSVTGIIIGTIVDNRFYDNEKEILHGTSQSISNEAELFFGRYVTIVEQMSKDKNVQSFMVRTNKIEGISSLEGYNVVVETLKDSQKLEKDIILSIWIAEDDPSYNINSIVGASDSSYDITTSKYYKTITDGVVSISEPYLNVKTNSMVISITAPVYVNGKIVGLTGMDIGMDSLAKVVGEHQLGENGYFSLLTRDNIIVSHKDSNNILKSVKDVGLSDNLLKAIDNKNDEMIMYSYNNDMDMYMGNSVAIN